MRAVDEKLIINELGPNGHTVLQFPLCPPKLNHLPPPLISTCTHKSASSVEWGIQSTCMHSCKHIMATFASKSGLQVYNQSNAIPPGTLALDPPMRCRGICTSVANPTLNGLPLVVYMSLFTNPWLHYSGGGGD